MRDATYQLGKHRVYACPCGAMPHRPLQAEDTVARPYPKPCDSCGRNLAGRPFSIEDMNLWTRKMMAASKKKK
jgi:hypothetical protein